jgi:acyl-coenzyme A thioesterase PaaI-like protein
MAYYSKEQRMARFHDNYVNDTNNVSAPEGLKLAFAMTSKGSSRAFATINSYFQGWPGIVQGGILATMMDEAMGVAVEYLLERNVFTVELSTDFKEPALIGVELVVSGQVREVKGLTATAYGEVRRKADNALLTVGHGRYVLMKD